LDGAIVARDFPFHHQVSLRRPLGEGNSVFVSLSPAWDGSRAPEGQCALTLSTHTGLDSCWQLFKSDRHTYEARKAALAEKVLAGAEVGMPGLRGAARLVMPCTPITFQHFTRRKWGWVGGFPQTGLLRSFKAWAHPLAGGGFHFPGPIHRTDGAGTPVRRTNGVEAVRSRPGQILGAQGEWSKRMNSALWWIRRDLRLSDSQVLASAAQEANTVIPVSILDPGPIGFAVCRRGPAGVPV
jgi:hypothetical protein